MKIAQSKAKALQISTALMMAIMSFEAHAKVGQKVRTGIDEVGTEMMIAGGGLLLIGIIMAAWNFMMGGQIAKRYLYGALGGGLLLVFAPDIVDFVMGIGNK